MRTLLRTLRPARVGLTVLLTACSKPAERKPKTGVQEVRVEGNTNQHWRSSGFTRMISPLRFPTSVDERDRIEVWLKVPEGKKISARLEEAQHRHVLVYPPGTIADRVELLARKDGPAMVSDVRGTDIGEGGKETFHVYRREGDHLRGYAWARDDAAQQEEATDLLADLVRKESSQTSRQARGVDKFRTLNNCGGCHVHVKPEKPLGEKSWFPHRASDAMGFYAVQTVLEPTAPAEYSRPRDANMGDPFIHFTCAKGDAKPMETPNGGRSMRCGDGSAPHGSLDFAKARAANDPHAKEVCASRAALYTMLDDGARSAFAAAFIACSIGEATAPASTPSAPPASE